MARIEVLGNTPDTAAQGFFDKTREIPLKPGDKFSVGSITKMFTSTIVHQLVEEKKIELKDPMIRHLSAEWAAMLEEIPHGNKITVYQALSHRSGIYDYIVNTTFFYRMLDSKKWTPLSLLKLVKEEGKPKFTPGASFSYSNTNYLLLGALIEEVTKKPLKEIYQERIFDPIELKNTFFSEGPLGSNREGVSHGYFKEKDKLYDFQNFDSGWAWAAGGMISNTQDLIIFLKALTSGKLFKDQKTFDTMCALPKGNDWYALGIINRTHPALGRVYSHSGYDGATSSVVCYYPKSKTLICVCLNYNGAATRLRAIHLADKIMR